MTTDPLPSAVDSRPLTLAVQAPMLGTYPMARRAHSVYHSGMITLVHGTWPRGFFREWLNIVRRLLGLKPKPLWFQSESPFRENLERSLKDASLDCEIRSFCWSGANSVFARAAAADELESVLREDLDQSQDARPVVIAHSHGGNIALRAIDRLGADASRIRLVTLATPFLKVFVRAKAGGGVRVVLFLLLLAANSRHSFRYFLVVHRSCFVGSERRHRLGVLVRRCGTSFGGFDRRLRDTAA